jgi:hypothetical protein
MMEHVSDKGEALQRAHDGWAALWDLIDSMPPGQIDEPLGDGWSVKVHIAHVAAWERSTAALLRKQHRGDALGISRDLWATHDVERINAAIADRSAAFDWATTEAQSRAVHDDLVSLVESMTQEDLERPYSDYVPDDPPYNATPVIAWVNGNTCDHYDEHISWIRAGLGDR